MSLIKKNISLEIPEEIPEAALEKISGMIFGSQIHKGIIGQIPGRTSRCILDRIPGRILGRIPTLFYSLPKQGQ